MLNFQNWLKMLSIHFLLGDSCIYSCLFI